MLKNSVSYSKFVFAWTSEGGGQPNVDGYAQVGRGDSKITENVRTSFMGDLLTIFLLGLPNHALKELYVLNHGTKYNTNSSYYSSIEVLIHLINSVTAIPL